MSDAWRIDVGLPSEMRSVTMRASTIPRSMSPCLRAHTPPHLSHTHTQAACTHSHAGRTHHVNPLRAQLLRFLACMRLLTCSVPPQGVTPAPAVTPSSEETASDTKVTLPTIGPIILPISP